MESDTPIRICHVLNWTASGGGSGQAKTLLDGWNAHPELEAWAIHASNLGSPENFVSDDPGYPVMFPANMADGIREIDPDIVFVHGYSPELNQNLRELSEGDDVDAAFILRKGMNMFEHWLGGAADARQIVHQITNLGWYDAVICPTQAVGERMHLMYGDDSPTLAYVSNAIKRDEYVPSSYLSDGWLKIVTASRGAPNNMLLSPLLAVARIIDNEEFPVKLDMYGASSGQHDAVMQSLADGFDDINVYGYVDHDELKMQMEASDVVCVPSISHQAVPLAAVEGMAAGNVVLTSFPEAQEEEALINVPATHPPAWREAIRDAYDDPEDAREWVTTGIERAALYDVDTVVEEGYLPVFRQVLDDRT